jgi:hypothetical protein
MTLHILPGFFKKQTGVSPNEYKVQGADGALLKVNAG